LKGCPAIIFWYSDKVSNVFCDVSFMDAYYLQSSLASKLQPNER
jgi:hypothetical protein